MTTSFEKKLLGGLGLASMIIAGVTVVYYASTSRLLTSSERIAEVHEFAGALNDFAAAMQTARVGTRGYVLTGDPDVLEIRRAANEHIPETLATLRRLAVLDPSWQHHMSEIERMAEANLQENERLMELRESAGGLAATISAGLNYRKDVEDPLRHTVDHMLQEARSELATRERMAHAGRNALLMMLVFGAFVELGFAVAAV